jgi:hypothetical protein
VSFNVPVSVSESPLTITGVKCSVPAGKGFTKTVANFTNGDLLTNPSDYTSTINWGDGSPTVAGLIQQTGPGTFQVVGAHKYNQPSNGYSIAVTVTEIGDGTISTTSVCKATKGGK